MDGQSGEESVGSQKRYILVVLVRNIVCLWSKFVTYSARGIDDPHPPGPSTPTAIRVGDRGPH